MRNNCADTSSTGYLKMNYKGKEGFPQNMVHMIYERNSQETNIIYTDLISGKKDSVVDQIESSTIII